MKKTNGERRDVENVTDQKLLEERILYTCNL